MQVHIYALLAWAVLSNAWMPNDRNLFGSQNGTNPSNSTVTARHRGRSSRRWVPASGKIRGVNLGSLFVMEPWMAIHEWNSMGCGGTNSEFDCVSRLGQNAANSAFQAHWKNWITQQDIQQMQSFGLNTIRIPVGFWINEDLVYSDSEYFPQGGLQYLEQVVGWASDAGLYIIIDLHGAPGAQVAQNSFTGQVSAFLPCPEDCLLAAWPNTCICYSNS